MQAENSCIVQQHRLGPEMEQHATSELSGGGRNSRFPQLSCPQAPLHPIYRRTLQKNLLHRLQLQQWLDLDVRTEEIQESSLWTKATGKGSISTLFSEVSALPHVWWGLCGCWEVWWVIWSISCLWTVIVTVIVTVLLSRLIPSNGSFQFNLMKT